MKAVGLLVAACAVLALGCQRKLPRLVVTETIGPGVNTDTAEYHNGSTHVVSRVLHFYNLPTGDHSEAGDFTAVFRAVTGKDLAEPAAVRSASALLSALEKEGVKLIAEPAAKTEEGMAPKVRAFTVVH